MDKGNELEEAMGSASLLVQDLWDLVNDAPVGVDDPETNRENALELRKFSREARALLDKLNRVLDPLDLSS